MTYQALRALTYSVLILLTMFLILQTILGNSAYASTSLSSQIPESHMSSCIIYDPEEDMIIITCQSANLSDIYAIIRDQNVLLKESDLDADIISGSFDGNNDNVWQLNAGIIVAQNATLYINSTDTSWLKILADGESAHPILISGSLNMDSVKVTSWNPNTNNYATSQDSDRNGQM